MSSRIAQLVSRLQSLSVRRMCRQLASAHSNCPVEIVAGNGAPQLTGDSYYWTTPSGHTVVRHPNAYGWPTWYHASTLCVQVGREWLIRQLAATTR